MDELTMDQAALVLGVSRQTLYNRLADLPPDSGPYDIVQAEVEALRAKIRRIEGKLKLAATPAAP